MAAGDSAALEAQLQLDFAELFERYAVVARQSASNFNAGAASERRLYEALKPLESEGYRVLADRRWPGSKKANVDFIVVGPSGIYIVDAKSWADVQIEQRSRDDVRIYRGQADVTDEIAHLADLADAAQSHFVELGLAPGEVRAIAAFTNRSDIRATIMTVEVMSQVAALRHIAGAPRRLTESQVELVLAAVYLHFPPYDLQPAAVTVTVKPPVSVTPTVVVDEPPALISADDLHREMIEGVLAEPIEQWMSFLHPEQAKLARKSFSGPSRIRGAAGTGKTVVGLHRAAYLARTRPGKVLVTTFVRTLPAVLHSLMRRMAPEVADRIEFVNVHRFALDLLAERGIRSQLNGKAASAAWSMAWSRIGATGRLATIDSDRDYWHEEICNVIKSRGITTLQQYENCARIGRRRGLTLDQRAAVWELYAAYEGELSARGAWDFEDVINAAAGSLREHPLEGYSAVVIDEAQDLSAAMVRMLHGLVGDAPDGLNLIGDGKQTIYPGGYTLAELGISIAGRGVVMSRNYRNTVEIVDFANALILDDQAADIEGGTVSSDQVQIERRGARPTVARFRSVADHDNAMVTEIRRLIVGGTPPGSIGVIAQTNRQAGDAASFLTRIGVKSIDLEHYDGTQTDAVKVGTIKRAKGLEFATVLVLRVPAASVALAAPDADDVSSARERRALDRRELYVAMTRARDSLWVGIV